jgi:hypothetical protein
MVTQLAKAKTIEYEVFEDRVWAGDWRVEGFDYTNDGQCYVTIFSGPDSKERAEEYFTWLSQQA